MERYQIQLQPEIVRAAEERWQMQSAQVLGSIPPNVASAASSIPNAPSVASGGYVPVGQYQSLSAQPGVPADSGIPVDVNTSVSVGMAMPGGMSANPNEVPPLDQWAREQSSLDEAKQVEETKVPPPPYQVVAHYNPGSGYGPA